MRRFRELLAFLYDFFVGDDWRIAVGVVVALGLTYGLSQTAVPAWWFLVVAVALILALSVRRAARS